MRRSPVAVRVSVGPSRDLIEHYYRTLLGREPQPGELKIWKNYAPEMVKQAIMNSAEYERVRQNARKR